MCDTLIALPETTSSGLAILAKNSDRPPNEAQYLEWIPERHHPAGSKLRCTYLEIPQVERTWAALLSKPYWMWGGEMGVNQHGLAIGNEAVFSKIPAQKEPALLGMDLLRLGLERAATAQGALEVITSLLEEFGQGGNCVEQGHLYYHNSYLIADPQESWVLETIDRHWAARRVNSLYSISNLLTLGNRWDRASSNLEEDLRQQGFAHSRETIDLAGDLSDLIYTTFADGRRRCSRSRALLDENRGGITIETMAGILRDHGLKDSPLPGLAGASICMHAGLGPIRVSQTTGSLIARLEAGNPLILATGTAAPCTAIFKPVWIDAPLDEGPLPGNQFAPGTLFWSHEALHREVIRNYPERSAAYQDERDVLEKEFMDGARELQDAPRDERRAYSKSCFERAWEAERRWLKEVRSLPVRAPLSHQLAWRGFNRDAGYHPA